MNKTVFQKLFLWKNNFKKQKIKIFNWKHKTGCALRGEADHVWLQPCQKPLIRACRVAGSGLGEQQTLSWNKGQARRRCCWDSVALAGDKLHLTVSTQSNETVTVWWWQRLPETEMRASEDSKSWRFRDAGSSSKARCSTGRGDFQTLCLCSEREYAPVTFSISWFGIIGWQKTYSSLNLWLASQGASKNLEEKLHALSL